LNSGEIKFAVNDEKSFDNIFELRGNAVRHITFTDKKKKNNNDIVVFA
jgi:hypothetical protein